ncbi:MAG: PAS domain S-box protein [Gammaproteobacteria bacterium]|nr:PAS domain S-box protein [Gammaproteobacteria bacterium]
MELTKDLLQDVISGANLGFWEWYYQTGEHHVSDLWLNILGLEQTDLIGNEVDWSERIHPDDKVNVDQQIQNAIDKDIPYRIEFRMKHKQGSWVWIEGSGRVIEWDKNHTKPIRLCGTHQDITERKFTEEMAQRFHQVVERSLNEIYIFDSETTFFINVNKGAQKNLGYTMMELKSMTPVDIKPEFSIEAFNKMVTPLRTGVKEIIQFETVHKRKNGSLYPVEIHLQLMTHNKPVFVAMVIDITKRKQAEKLLRNSEERFKALSQAAYGGIIIHEQGVILECNEGLSEITGFSYEELINSNGLELIEPGSLETVLSNIKKGYERSYDVEGVRKNGSVYPLSIKGKNIIYKGRDTRVIEFLDITERKKSEAEQIRLQNELHQAHKMEALGQLTGGIAHDFNNILGIIMGYTSLTLQKHGSEIPEKVVDYLQTTMKASERARSLVAQMLTFSRSGNADAQPLQITPLIKENVKMLYSILPSTMNIELNYDKNLPNILISAAQLQQLLINLCLNAKDAMKGVGCLAIDLSLHRHIDTECADCQQRIQGDWIELSVADTGCGIAPDTLKHIFDPFFTTKEVGEGTGMGLSVLHGIIQSHGAHTLVETELGKGTTFRLLFPPLLDNNQALSETEGLSEELPQGEGQHVLVVDDEPGLAEYIGDLLKLHGYQPTITTDSQKALRLFQKNPDKFALLVTDQTMPGLTGMDLIEHFREIRENLPVVLCTGHSETINKDGAKRKSVNYLSKPINSDQLIQLAGDLLEG